MGAGTNQNPFGNSQGVSGGGVANSSAVNTSLQQMMLMNMSGLDNSHINERVQLELEQLMDDFEDQKILHERNRRDQLKKLEQDKIGMIKIIEEEAVAEAKQLVKRMKKEQQNKTIAKAESRKTDLQLEKDKKIRELKEQERAKSNKQEKIQRERNEKLKQD